jgi:hypothetical protein
LQKEELNVINSFMRENILSGLSYESPLDIERAGALSDSLLLIGWLLEK